MQRRTFLGLIGVSAALPIIGFSPAITPKPVMVSGLEALNLGIRKEDLLGLASINMDAAWIDEFKLKWYRKQLETRLNG